MKTSAVWLCSRLSHQWRGTSSGNTTVTTVSAATVCERISSRSGGRSPGRRVDEHERHVDLALVPALDDLPGTSSGSVTM